MLPLRFCAVALATLAIAVVLPASADDQKLLTNMRGDVSYQRSAGAQHQLAASARVALVDGDSAQTADDSLAKITLSNATTILVGENTRLQLNWFHPGAMPAALLTVAGGQVRFSVIHRDDLPANFTFKTPTSEIAVRGTIGDISVDSDDELKVNVYELGSAAFPLIVRFRSGEISTIKAGEALDASYSDGVLHVDIRPIDPLSIDVFEQFGPPPGNYGGENSIGVEK